jgi:hypothetical protein
MNVIVTTQIQCVQNTSFDLARTHIQVQNFTITSFTILKDSS